MFKKLVAILIFITLSCTSTLFTACTKEVSTFEGNSEKCVALPDKSVNINNDVGWYLSPTKLMYSSDNRTIAVNMHEALKYEKFGWYKEPVALLTKDGETKYALKSEIEKERQNGWQISRFGPELYNLGVQLERYIETKSGKYGIYIKNLNNGQTLIINDEPYSPASIIKLFVMAGTYGKISENPNIRTKSVDKMLDAMITISDNYASNYLVRIMGSGNYKKGFDAENNLIKSLGCANTSHNALFIGFGDYVSYGKNTVSPLDCGIVLEKIYNGTLISKKYSEEMLNLLKRQTRRNKIPYLLPEGTVCANKTGETDTVQSDVGIVYSENADYIICVLTNNARTGIEDIQEISLMVYNYFN